MKWKIKKNWFKCPTSRLQTALGYPAGRQQTVSWPFNSHLLPKIIHICQKSPLTQLCICQTPSLPMSKLSLCKALDTSNPDIQVWMDSYKEENQGLINHEVYEKISKNQYLSLRRVRKILKAILSMCVLVMKNNKDGKPLRAKSWIVVLGNFEDHLYQKSQRYAPVLKYSSLRLLKTKAVGDKQILKQGDCKNAFCNSTIPDNEVTVIRPPIGDPAFQEDEYWLLKKTLYGIRQFPHHWYNMIKGILLNMGLKDSPHDPCLLSGILEKPNSHKSIS